MPGMRPADSAGGGASGGVGRRASLRSRECRRRPTTLALLLLAGTGSAAPAIVEMLARPHTSSAGTQLRGALQHGSAAARRSRRRAAWSGPARGCPGPSSSPRTVMPPGDCRPDERRDQADVGSQSCSTVRVRPRSERGRSVRSAGCAMVAQSVAPPTWSANRRAACSTWSRLSISKRATSPARSAAKMARCSSLASSR